MALRDMIGFSHPLFLFLLLEKGLNWLEIRPHIQSVSQAALGLAGLLLAAEWEDQLAASVLVKLYMAVAVAVVVVVVVVDVVRQQQQEQLPLS